MLTKKPPAEMLAIAKQTMQQAYAPYSRFLVGVCLRAVNGQLFAGCNIENASYSLALCGEASALSAMIVNGQRQWSDIVIVTSAQQPCPPCGACRQRLLEFVKDDGMFHLIGMNDNYQQISMKELLPLAFTNTNIEPL